MSSLTPSADLSNQAQGDPLVVGVVHLVITEPLAGTVTLECWRDVEGGVHPAVGLQRGFTHPSSGLVSIGTYSFMETLGVYPYQITLYGVSKELVRGDHDR